MSDEQMRNGETAPRRSSGIVEHYCEHPGCSSWGGWGYSRLKDAPRWFCYAHRDEGERYIGRHDG
ncbi:hypothetical protein L598_000700000510 [Mesorhizobium sp. J18]|uniref:hypothetical protein n=1 Tax=Mesorhizobium sp. J18 TaxID=935263 RepID=UPI00119A249B|nr:hypothetical protein [Mesorhizobium sp. J18]TWG90295.1 hypothetical protein L598_000700000510 [Mesorhizobium sp. J18]